MSLKYCLALALVPCAVGAQQINPADPLASVPAASHVSAFKDYRSATAAKTTPDRAWRPVNAQVGSEAGGGHALHGAMPAMPALHQPPPVAVKTGLDPHAGHTGHESHQ